MLIAEAEAPDSDSDEEGPAAAGDEDDDGFERIKSRQEKKKDKVCLGWMIRRSHARSPPEDRKRSSNGARQCATSEGSQLSGVSGDNRGL